MKQALILSFVLFFCVKTIAQQLKIEVLTPIEADKPTVHFTSADDKDILTIEQQAANKEVKLKLSITNATKDVYVKAEDKQRNTAKITTDYDYDVSLPNIYLFTTDNKEENITITVKSTATITNTVYAELDFKWESLTEKDKYLHKILLIKILKKTATTEEVKGKETGWIDDKENYLKTEIVQYTDITALKNDKPNGLLQFQGIIKIPIYKSRWAFKHDWFVQPFRAVLIDAVVNRIDKSKEEVDYNYTNFLLNNTNDTAKMKSPNPWLATMDIWRYSNLQIGLRVVPLAIEKGNFRVQLQAGIKLLKNLPFTADTIRTPGPDSGKVKSDFRSVYSNVKYMELYIKTIKTNNSIDLALNAGVMWLKLMDSYYEQIDVHQQDPFNRAVALSPVTKSKKSPPIWFASLRVGVALGEEKIVNTFLRVGYMLQTGYYPKPLTTDIVAGKPVRYEEKKFYNNFFQVHLGTTIALDKVFAKKDDKAKKDDGPTGPSVQ